MSDSNFAVEEENPPESPLVTLLSIKRNPALAQLTQEESHRTSQKTSPHPAPGPSHTPAKETKVEEGQPIVFDKGGAQIRA